MPFAAAAAAVGRARCRHSKPIVLRVSCLQGIAAGRTKCQRQRDANAQEEGKEYGLKLLALVSVLVWAAVSYSGGRSVAQCRRCCLAGCSSAQSGVCRAESAAAETMRGSFSRLAWSREGEIQGVQLRPSMRAICTSNAAHSVTDAGPAPSRPAPVPPAAESGRSRRACRAPRAGPLGRPAPQLAWPAWPAAAGRTG